MRVLHGQKLANAIIGMLDHEDGLRCAVAFWGPEMARRARERGATVILDLAMRGTTRNALSALGVTPAPMPEGTGDRVRVLDWMHAKLYLGRDVAIIGSANASGNALGRDGGKPKLWEAGVLIQREKEARAYGKVEALWNSLLSASRAVYPDDLDKAPLVAATDAARDRGEGSHLSSTSILVAAISRPNDFVSATFVFGDHDISAPELKVVESDFTEVQGDTPKNQKRGLICACSAGDENDVLLRPTLTVIMFWFGRQPDLYAYHDIVRTELEGRVSYFGRRSWRVVGSSLGMAAASKIMAWTTDRTVAERMCDIKRQPGRERYVVMSTAATVAWLETSDAMGIA